MDSESWSKGNKSDLERIVPFGFQSETKRDLYRFWAWDIGAVGAISLDRDYVIVIVDPSVP